MTLTPGMFAVLTLVAAPAVLTNASSVLALNTANRFGRVIDRARVLGKELGGADLSDELRALRLTQLASLRRRGRMLTRAQSAIYAALGAFVATALVAVVGALLASTQSVASTVVGVFALLVGTGGAGSLIHGCTLLVRETRLALAGLSEDLPAFLDVAPTKQAG